MTNPIQIKLSILLGEIFNNENLVIDEQSSIDAIKDWDSFKHVEILIGVEELFKVKFHANELDSIKTIKDLVLKIEEKLPN